jgi:hypothetical protein
VQAAAGNSIVGPGQTTGGGVSPAINHAV